MGKPITRTWIYPRGDPALLQSDDELLVKMLARGNSSQLRPETEGCLAAWFWGFERVADIATLMTALQVERAQGLRVMCGILGQIAFSSRGRPVQREEISPRLIALMARSRDDDEGLWSDGDHTVPQLFAASLS